MFLLLHPELHRLPVILYNGQLDYTATIMGMKDTAGQWEITNMPKLIKTPDATNYSNNGGSSWYVTSHCKNPQLAFDFLAKTFAGSTELYDNILPKTGAIATYAPVADSEAYNAPQEFWNNQPIFATIVDYSTKVPTNRTAIFVQPYVTLSEQLSQILSLVRMLAKH
ncbi:MAG: hypothetical protein V8R80_03010 [Eubacterium sp.]